MRNLMVELENCFGIKKLIYEFDFNPSKINSIYAPNGTMKTSFTKTFKCIAEKTKPVDLINIDESSVANIKKDGVEALKCEEVLVIESYREEFKLDKVSTLLAKDELKKRYDSIHMSLDEKKNLLLSELLKVCGIKKKDEILQELTSSWGYKDGDVYECLKFIVDNGNDYEFPFTIKYRDIVNEKVEQFIDDKGNMHLIKEYIDKYDELISKSAYFEKGIFTHNNIEDISKNLDGNGFFKVKKIKNSLYINDEKIEKKSQLEGLLESEKIKIFSDEDLLNKFNKIDSILNKNAKLISFRNILEKNPEIVTYLKSFKELKKFIWVSYLNQIRETVLIIVKSYELCKSEIKLILDEAKKEKTLWNSVIDIYNERFDVPFIVEIDNKEDVILKENTPIIQFKYKVGDENKKIDENVLLNVLSNGEKRALYILNIIFEIEALRKFNKNILIVVDDIADSFDYKNKYAIIEYLNDILKSNLFNMLVLTHNFDFYRTLKGRLDINRENCLVAQKNDEGIKLIQGEYFKNIFNIWKNKLTNDRILIASIPFVRNLCEYLEEKDSPNYRKLTSLLHLKEETENIRIKDLEDIYQDVWKTNKVLKEKDRKVKNLIINEADKILIEKTEKINLENKIVLSMAIRLLAEKFMINSIKDKEKIKGITKNQTTGLFTIIKEENLIESKARLLLEQVNLMTPENIHINSFMYEPILDLSDSHLKKLYGNINELLSEAYTEAATEINM